MSTNYIGPISNAVPVFDLYDYRIYLQVQLAALNKPAYYARLMTKKDVSSNFVVPQATSKLVLSNEPVYYKNLGDLITALKRNPCPKTSTK